MVAARDRPARFDRSADVLIRPAEPADAEAITALLEAAFGPTRYKRTAALLRRGALPIEGPSLVASEDDGLLGSVQFWPIALVAGEIVLSLTLLGPLAVATPGLGIGRALLAASLSVADRIGLGPILLIGDHSYYGPFGFAADATGGWGLPGPVERERLLLRERRPLAWPVVAQVVAADSASAVTATMLAIDG